MKIRTIALTVLALATCGGAAHAQSQFQPQSVAIRPQGDVQTYCADPNRRMPAPGKQFDGKPADATIMALKPGKYDLADGGTIEIFDKGVWLLHKSPKMISFFGPGRYSGGEIQIGNGTVGGCSLELLSELQKKNNLSLLSAEPQK